MHATFTRTDRPHPPGRPHPVLLSVFNDAGDPPAWHIDTDSGENGVDLPADCTGDDVDRGLASLGCRRTGGWQQQTTLLWIAAIAPCEQH